MIYTSGTTGPSKGVLCSYMHYTSSGMAFPFVRQGDRGLVTLPLFHMGGTGSVYRYLLRGASIVVAGILPYPDLLGCGAAEPHHLRLAAWRHDILPGEGAALVAGPRPYAAGTDHRAADRGGGDLPRTLRGRGLHHLQHDRDRLRDLQRCQPDARRQLRPRRARASRPASSTTTTARCRSARSASWRCAASALVDQPRLPQQPGGDGAGLAQRLVPHRRRLPPRRRGQVLLRRPDEGRHPSAGGEHLLLRGGGGDLCLPIGARGAAVGGAERARRGRGLAVVAPMPGAVSTLQH